MAGTEVTNLLFYISSLLPRRVFRVFFMPTVPKGSLSLTTVANLRDLPQIRCVKSLLPVDSNAGKSSAINPLAGRVRLAFVGKTPGRTQHLNYFALEEGKYFVNLPGYGLAKAPKPFGPNGKA